MPSLDALLAAPVGALLIFLLRVTDVSMSMTRMILAVKGYRGKAAFIGFFEVLVWLFAVGSALQHLDSIYHLIGYAAGYATGNYLGVTIEARVAVGINVVRAVVQRDSLGNSGMEAANMLREHGFAVTETAGRERDTEVDILNVVVRRKSVPDVLRLVRAADPAAFVTVEEVRSAHGGHLAPARFANPAGRKLPFLTRAAA